jgi:AcrR family transcriptional regulator
VRPDGTSAKALSPRQAALLDGLREIYVREGFAGTPLDDIAARLSCSKGTLYALAATRADLSAAVVDLHFRLASGRIAARVASAGRAAEQLRAYLLGVAAETRAVSLAFIEDLGRVPATRRVYEYWVDRTADQVRAIIAGGIASGEFRAVHATFLGEVVTAVMANIEYGDLRERTGLTHAGAYEHLADTIVNAVAGDAPGETGGTVRPVPPSHGSRSG